MLREAIRQQAPRGAQIAKGESLPAPVGGWDASSPIADMPEDRAVVLDNWFPTPKDVRVRRGHQVHANGMGSGVVDTLMSYHGATNAASKLFAASGGAIYDVTASGAGTSAVSSLSSNRWQHVNFTTSGGHFLFCCNGADDCRHFNGSSWATPSLTITGYSSSEVVNVNAHKNRIWLVLKDSLDAAYLPTGAVAGTATVFPLGGIMTQCGHLVAMATMTRDGGDGEDDLAAFISSKGQVAVYAGTDPGSASTWALIGVYDVGPPIGYRCFTKVGGDLALINLDGILPLSQALQQDRAAAELIAISARINDAMNDAARDYSGNFGWQLQPYPRGTYVLLNVPIQEGSEQHQYVMNTLTGAWCRFTGQNANCWTLFRDELYFGGNAGSVFKADQTGLDSDQVISATGQGAYSYYGSRGLYKEFTQLQSVMTADSQTRPALGISTDFKDNATLGVPTSAEDASALYGTAVYGVDVYAIESRTVTDWASISGGGYAASIHFRASSGRTTGVGIWGVSNWGEGEWSYPISGDVTLELNSFNMIYEKGQVF